MEEGERRADDVVVTRQFLKILTSILAEYVQANDAGGRVGKVSHTANEARAVLRHLGTLIDGSQ